MLNTLQTRYQIITYFYLFLFSPVKVDPCLVSENFNISTPLCCMHMQSDKATVRISNSGTLKSMYCTWGKKQTTISVVPELLPSIPYSFVA